MNFSRLPLWAPLGSLLLALAWLLPNANPPWVAFHKDAWTAFTVILVTAVFFVKQRLNRESFSLDILSGFLLLLFMATALQWFAGIIEFSGHAVVGALYFVAASLSVVAGRTWESLECEKLGDFVFASFLLGAFGTSALMLVQWCQMEVTTVWINELPAGGRPYGNLVQPNNAATLLLWGLLAVVWFGLKGGLNKLIIGVLGAYLTFCVALTGSRIGALSFAILMIWGFVLGFRYEQLRGWRLTFFVLLVLFPLFVFIASIDWGQHQIASGAVNYVNPINRDLSSVRLLAYRVFAHGSMLSPWFGYGFGQSAEAQLAVGGLGYQLPSLFTWTHNIYLDLSIWFGLPAAVLAIVLTIRILWLTVKIPFDVTTAIYFSCIFVFLMHSMVELPHTYAYFLIPSCLMAGALMSRINSPLLRLPRFSIVIAIMLLVLMLFVIVVDYLRIESSFNTWRFKQARVGKNHAMDIPHTMVLDQFEALLVGLRGSSETLSGEQMNKFEQAVILFPSAAAIQQLAELQLRRGSIVAAQKTADNGRLLTTPAERKALAARWAYLGTQEPIFKLVEWRE